MKKLLASILMMGILTAGGTTALAAGGPQNGMSSAKTAQDSWVCQNPDCPNYGETVLRDGTCSFRLSEDGKQIFCRNSECLGICPQDGTGMQYRSGRNAGWGGCGRRN
ncbi:MAG: hypothetical protein ACOX6P_10555 [Candidatus Merdivicinus sp.]